MSSGIQFTDILIALEPTGFSSQDASLVLGLVATGFIVTMGSLFAFAYKDRVLSFKRREQELRTLLKGLKEAHPERVSSPASWDGDIGPKIKEIEWLQDGWNSYRDQCTEKGNKIASLSHADVHFADIEPPASGFSKQISGILTSIGILGTFIGITVGLGKIGQDMGGGSSDEMQAAMSSLISSLGVSFRTSIWGLIGSMLTTVFTSRAASLLEIERRRLVTWINETMPQRSERAMMAEQTELAEQQLKATEEMGDVIASRIVDAINGPSGLKGAIDKMTDIIAESQQSGLDALVEQFMQQMKSSMNADFSTLGTALQDMVASNEQFQVSMAQLIQHLKGATNNQGAAAEQMQTAIKSAAAAIAEMKGSLSGLGTVSSSIQDAATAMQRILDKQMNASQQQENTIGKMMTGMSDQANGMLNSQQEILKVGEALSTHFSSLSESIEHLITWHNRVRDGLNQQIGSLMSAVESLTVVTENLSTEHRTSMQIVSQLATTQTNLGPAANSLKGAGDAVKKASDSLFGTQKEIRNLTSKVRDAVNELTDRQIQALDQYNSIQTSLSKLLKK